MSEAAKRVAIYSQESSRPDGQVVGPGGTTLWPNGLILLQTLLCLVLKQNICFFSVESGVGWCRVEIEVRVVVMEVMDDLLGHETNACSMIS